MHPAAGDVDVPALPPVLAITPSFAWLAAAFLLGSCLNIGWNVITVSLRQRIVPDHLLGLVNAGYRLLAWGTMPFGAALSGVIGARWGIEAVFWTSAALGAVCLPLVFVVTDAELAAAESASAPATRPGRGSRTPSTTP